MMRIVRSIERIATHCILDAARVGPPMDQMRTLAAEGVSLYRGSAEEQLRAVAPYLLRWTPQSELSRNFFNRGWGHAWGILLGTTAPLPALQRHLRQFLTVQDEQRRKLYFRFYDPRVLRIFLPTCSRAQLKQLFGPILYIVLEDENPDRALIFQLDRGDLRRDVVDLTRDSDVAIVPPVREKKTGRQEDALIV